MTQRYVVTRDSEIISPVFDNPVLAIGWLLCHQPHSTLHATQYEGYDIKEVLA